MWTEHKDHLSQEFSFPDFVSALKFVNQVGEIAESQQHHPDIELGWGRVKITLSTHSAQAVTDKDRQLAQAIDSLSK